MNAAVGGMTRVAAIALVIVLAAALGLAVGNVLNQRETSTSPSLGNFSANNRGGTVVRAPEVSDYGLRHPAQAAEESDFGLRHPSGAATTLPGSGQRKAADATADSFSTQDYADWHRAQAEDAASRPTAPTIR